MKKSLFLRTLFVGIICFMLMFTFTSVFALTGLNEQSQSTQSAQQPKNAVQTSPSDETEQVTDNGSIDWEKGVVLVTGVGASPEGASKATGPVLALRAAKADAYRNAVEVLKGVRVDSLTYIKNAVVESDEISNSVQGVIRGGQFQNPTYDVVDNAYRCEVVLVIPVGGQKGLVTAVADYLKQQGSQAKPETTTDSEKQNPPAAESNSNPETATDSGQNPPAAEKTEPATANQAKFTGIIIDARNLALKPALCPQIFSSDGNLLYNQSMVNLNQSQYSTIVGYSRLMDKAVAMPRVGSNPLKLKAASVVKATSGENTDVVLDTEATNAFREAANQGDLLPKAAVVIVIN